MADEPSESEGPMSSSGSTAPAVTTDPLPTEARTTTSSAAARPGDFWTRLGERLSWTAPQRRAMVVLLGVVLIVLLWRAVRDRAYVSDPQPAVPARFHELANKLDPNTASWEELVALPQLGEKRAKGIVEHREEWKRWHPGEQAYKEPLDLVAVRGIGGAMVETLTPYLMFPPASAPASRPTAATAAPAALQKTR